MGKEGDISSRESERCQRLSTFCLKSNSKSLSLSPHTSTFSYFPCNMSIVTVRQQMLELQYIKRNCLTLLNVFSSCNRIVIFHYSYSFYILLTHWQRIVSYQGLAQVTFPSVIHPVTFAGDTLPYDPVSTLTHTKERTIPLLIFLTSTTALWIQMLPVMQACVPHAFSERLGDHFQGGFSPAQFEL